MLEAGIERGDMSWLFRGKGAQSAGNTPTSDKKSKPTKAHLGETSKFYYNEKLKRWCVEGEEDDEGDANSVASSGPPPMSRNVSLDYLPGSAAEKEGDEAAYDNNGFRSHGEVGGVPKSMPGSPRRGASLRQRYYDPGYMTKPGQGENGQDVPTLSLPDKPPLYGGNGDHSSQSQAKKPITLFVPQVKSKMHSDVVEESHLNGSADGRKSSFGDQTAAASNFATPWSAEPQNGPLSQAEDAFVAQQPQQQQEGEATRDEAPRIDQSRGEETHEYPIAASEEAFGAASLDHNSNQAEDPFSSQVEDQFAHLDYDQAKQKYFEEKERQQMEVEDNPDLRLDDLNSFGGAPAAPENIAAESLKEEAPPVGQHPPGGEEGDQAAHGDAMAQPGTDYHHQGDYQSQGNGGSYASYGGYGGAQEYGAYGEYSEAVPQEGVASTTANESDKGYGASYDYNGDYNTKNGQGYIQAHHQHFHSIDSQAESLGLDLSSYNSSYNNVTQLGASQEQEAREETEGEKMAALQRQLDELAAKLLAAEEEKTAVRAELETERRANAELALANQSGVPPTVSTSAPSRDDEADGELTPKTPAASEPAPEASAEGLATAGGNPKDTYSTIKRSLQEKIEELELNDLEKHKLLLENYRLQESLREKDGELTSLQSDMNDLLVCLGQESAKVQALVPFAEQAGEDVDTLLAKVEEEAAMEAEEDEEVEEDWGEAGTV